MGKSERGLGANDEDLNVIEQKMSSSLRQSVLNKNNKNLDIFDRAIERGEK